MFFTEALLMSTHKVCCGGEIKGYQVNYLIPFYSWSYALYTYCVIDELVFSQFSVVYLYFR